MCPGAPGLLQPRARRERLDADGREGARCPRADTCNQREPLRSLVAERFPRPLIESQSPATRKDEDEEGDQVASVLLKFCPSHQWSTRGALWAPVLRTQPSCNAERGSQGHSQVRAPWRQRRRPGKRLGAQHRDLAALPGGSDWAPGRKTLPRCVYLKATHLTRARYGKASRMRLPKPPACWILSGLQAGAGRPGPRTLALLTAARRASNPHPRPGEGARFAHAHSLLPTNAVDK